MKNKISISEKISGNPLKFFFWGVVLATIFIAVAWYVAINLLNYFVASPGVLVLGSIEEFLSGEKASFSDLLSNTSAITAAVVGTSVALASAFVAVMLASTATNIAKASLTESKASNKINSPDYASAKVWYSKIFELSSVHSALIYSYNTIKHNISGNKDLSFAPNHVLLDRIEKIITTPEFSVFLDQCSRLKNKVFSDDVSIDRNFALQKATMDLLSEVEFSRQRKDLNEYYMNLMFFFSVFIEQINLVDWNKYVTKENKNKFLDKLPEFTWVSMMVEDGVKFPLFTTDNTVNSVISHKLLEGSFNFVVGTKEMLTMAMFPAMATKSFERTPIKKDLGELFKYSRYSHLFFGDSVTDAAMVRAVNGDVYVREEIIDKAIYECSALGYSPVVCNYIVDLLAKDKALRDIEKLLSEGKKPFLIVVEDASNGVDNALTRKLFAENSLRKIDQVIIFDNFTNAVASTKPAEKNDEFSECVEIRMAGLDANNEGSPEEKSLSNGFGDFGSKILKRSTELFYAFSNRVPLAGSVGVIAINYVPLGTLNAFEIDSYGGMITAADAGIHPLFLSGALARVVGSTVSGVTDCAMCSKL